MDTLSRVGQGGRGGEEVSGASKSLWMLFESTPGGGPGCRWRLELSGGLLPSTVYEIHTWAHSKVRLEQGATVALSHSGARAMALRIAGSGRDGRCRWCRTFRTGLKTALRRTCGREAFRQEGGCAFEAEKGGTVTGEAA